MKLLAIRVSILVLVVAIGAAGIFLAQSRWGRDVVAVADGDAADTAGTESVTARPMATAEAKTGHAPEGTWTDLFAVAASDPMVAPRLPDASADATARYYAVQQVVAIGPDATPVGSAESTSGNWPSPTGHPSHAPQSVYDTHPATAVAAPALLPAVAEEPVSTWPTSGANVSPASAPGPAPAGMQSTGMSGPSDTSLAPVPSLYAAEGMPSHVPTQELLNDGGLPSFSAASPHGNATWTTQPPTDGLAPHGAPIGTDPLPLIAPGAPPAYHAGSTPGHMGNPMTDVSASGRISTAPTSELGTGLPGPKQQEGVQTAQIQIEKIPPREAKIGQPARFVTMIRNAGPVAARAVEVVDRVPRGARLVSTQPQATRGDDQSLVWRLDTIAPGAEVALTMELVPTDEGEIGSVATVRFSAEATARAMVTRPMLDVVTTVPPQVNLGEEVALEIVLTNPGSGAATGVYLEQAVPASLRHPAGADIRYNVGTLQPNETKRLTLKMQCVKAGAVENVLVARGDANLAAESRAQFEIVAPSLELAIHGAKQRFLEQIAVYYLAVSNPGTASARNIELAAYLPPHLKFEGTDDVSKGQYDPKTHTVRWTLRELPVGKRGVVELKAVPIDMGEGALRFVGTDATGISAESVHSVAVDGIASISYEVRDTADPIEVGGQTTYEIQVTNQGTKDATQIQVFIEMPPELALVEAEGPTASIPTPGGTAFQPLATLPPKQRALYKVTAQGVRPGDARLRVLVQTADMATPVTKEESTKVFDGS